MRNTHMVLKNGDEWDGVLWYFRPEHDYFCFQLAQRFLPLPGPLWRWRRFRVSDMKSCVTKNERISASKIGDMDELERARQHLVDAQTYGWRPNEDDAPVDELERCILPQYPRQCPACGGKGWLLVNLDGGPEQAIERCDTCEQLVSDDEATALVARAADGFAVLNRAATLLQEAPQDPELWANLEWVLDYILLRPDARPVNQRLAGKSES